jgi:hypothetical protein
VELETAEPAISQLMVVIQVLQALALAQVAVTAAVTLMEHKL